MGDPSQDPGSRPRPDGPGRPRDYLPRIPYQVVEPAPVARPGPGAAAGPQPTEEPEPRRVLKEETPELDTVEARRKGRLIVGGVAGLLIAISGFVLLRALTGSDEVMPADDPLPVEIVGLRAPAIVPDRHADLLLGEARQFDRRGREEPARLRLALLVQNFPTTKAGAEAREALARKDRGEPLFPDPNAPPKPAPPPPEPELAPAPVVAEVVTPPPPPPPEVEPEPRRETGLDIPRADVPPRPLPAGFRARVEAGVHASGWPLEITCDRDGASMVLVPAGFYAAGSDTGRFSERPAHTVQLGSYYLDQHEVTNAQFARFRKATGRLAPRGTPPPDDLPAVNVTHEEAWSYAQWAGKRLPTEAQWEAAVRAGDGRPAPWGEPGPDRSKKPAPLAPVLSRPQDLSPLAAFDLGGNAVEWTGDWYDARYYQSLPRTGPAVDPLGPARPGGRTPEITIKGGSPRGEASWREGLKPDARLPQLGFRCALPVGDDPIEPPAADMRPEAAPTVLAVPPPSTGPATPAPAARPAEAPATPPTTPVQAPAPMPRREPPASKPSQGAPVPF